MVLLETQNEAASFHLEAKTNFLLPNCDHFQKVKNLSRKDGLILTPEPQADLEKARAAIREMALSSSSECCSYDAEDIATSNPESERLRART